MNYFQKNKKNIIIGVVSTLLVATLIALWLQSKSVNNPDDIVAVVAPENLILGDTLKFEDRTPNAKTRIWDFGDGKTSNKEKGFHIFSKTGIYEIKLKIDGKFTKTFPILVSSPSIIPTTPVEELRINAPSQVMQLENFMLNASPSNAKMYEWSFGESGRIDSNERSPMYSYKKAGNYHITLNAVDENNNRQTVTQTIRVSPVYNPMSQAPEEIIAKVDNSYDIINDDIKRTLQQIALGNNYNSNYNYLLNSYLCGNDNAAIVVNNNKTMNFYYYCMDLQYMKNFVIQEVKTTYDSTKKCIVKIEVTQTK